MALHRVVARNKPASRRRLAIRGVVAIGASSLLGLAATIGTAMAAAGDTQVVSVSKIGNAAGGANTSGPPAVSANGRYVLYGKRDTRVFLRDRWAGVTELISVSYTGGEPDNLSYNQALSGDGRYATFISWATNLVPGDNNGEPDIFLRDRQAGTTERISVNSNEIQANGGSGESAVSDDGRIVVFASTATNFVAASTNSPPIFVRNRELGTTRRLAPNPPWPLSGFNERLSMSADGRYVAFDAIGPGPLAERNVFLHDRTTNTTQRVSVPAHGGVLASSGGAESPAISADGRYVAFASQGSDFGPTDPDTDWDVYVWDRTSGAITRESYGYANWVRGVAYAPSLSGDGRFVSFGSASWNLIEGETIRNSRGNIYTRDRLTGAIERDSATYDGSPPDGSSIRPMLNRDGRWVVFKSYASNLVSNDNNGVADIFIHDRGAP
jgi:Tol biopolymer transport system component